MLEDIDAAGLLKPSDPPELDLGFRGFVVTPSDPSLPVLRIVPKTVYSVRGGSYEQYFDTRRDLLQPRLSRAGFPTTRRRARGPPDRDTAQSDRADAAEPG